MTYRKFIQTEVPSDFCLEDINNEIKRVQLRRWRENNKLKNLIGRLEPYLEAKIETLKDRNRELDRILNEINHRTGRLIYLNQALVIYQMTKEGTIPFPKPCSDRAWSREPHFDMILEEAHRNIQEHKEEWVEKEMEREMIEYSFRY